MDDLTPISVNSGVPVRISTDAFEGEVAVFIKGLEDPETGVARDTDYFRKRSGVTWSIQVQGAYSSYSPSSLPSHPLHSEACRIGVGWGVAATPD